MNLSVLRDDNKAQAASKSVDAALSAYSDICTNADNVQEMIRMLPGASSGRGLQSATIVGANDIEATCMLSLAPPPSSQQNDPILAQVSRLIHGGAVSQWVFSYIRIPGGEDTFLVRETATQAMIQGIQEVAVVLEAVDPPSSSVPETSKSDSLLPASISGPFYLSRRPVDLTGTWKMSRPDMSYLSLTVRISQHGDEITISHKDSTPSSPPWFTGKLVGDKSVVGRMTVSSVGDVSATMTIDGPDHITLDSGSTLTRVSAK